MEKQFESKRDEFLDARIEQEKQKSALEFNRYKQDCRKRALDLAHSERDRNYYGEGSTNLIQKNTTKTPEETMKIADKYYNWLISIPDHK